MRQSESGKRARDTYKYTLKEGNRILYFGITNDLARREKEHLRKFPDARLVRVGRKTTRDGALKWERQQFKKGHIGSGQVRQAAKFAIKLNREAIKELEHH